MTKLYIGNPTVQIREMQYRLVGSNGVYSVKIMPRSQTRDASGHDQRRDRRHHRAAVRLRDGQGDRRGLRAHARRGRFTRLARRSPARRLQQAVDRNTVLLQQEGLKLRQAAAVGVSTIMQDSDPSSYLGAKVTIQEKSEDATLNELHLHRQDGDYEHMGDMDTPVHAAPIKRGRGRPRRVVSA